MTEDSQTAGPFGTTDHPSSVPPPFTPSPSSNDKVGWDLAQASYGNGRVLDLPVIGNNRGGLLVDLGGLRGFVPTSQLASFPHRVSEEERAAELGRYQGRTLKLKVIELDRLHNRLILSERVAHLPTSRVEQTLEALQAGQTRRGVIRNVTAFGAFVDLGGVEGLIHVSEMSWQRVNHPSDVCRAGDSIEVMIMEVNRDQRRVALSLKRLCPDPWSLVAKNYKPGDVVQAQITNVMPFGAFAKLPEGVEGLVHTSELAEGNFLHPRDVVSEGQVVRVRIMNVDAARQRIGLSLRLNAEGPHRTVQNSGEPPPPPDAGYWESLARED